MPQVWLSHEDSDREVGKKFVFDGVEETILGYYTGEYVPDKEQCEQFMYSLSVRPLGDYGTMCAYITEWTFEAWCQDDQHRSSPVYSQTWGPGELMYAMGSRRRGRRTGWPLSPPVDVLV